MRIITPQWFETLPSTNAWLKECLLAGEAILPGTVIAARTQTDGRGRKERRWETGCGNLAFSVYIVSQRGMAELPTLPMVCALAVAEYLDVLGLSAELKWPNDILIGGKKVCGILSEIIRSSLESADIVVGVGLNLNMSPEECVEIERSATSVCIESGENHEAGEVLDALLPNLVRTVDCWEREGFGGLRPGWIRRAAKLGEPVQISSGTRHYAGRFTDIGPLGELILATENGPQSIQLGEVL